MNAAPAIRFHSVKNPGSPFRWKRYAILASVVTAFILAIRLDGFLGGLLLEGSSAFSVIIPLAVILVFLIPILLIRTAAGLYRIVRGSEPWHRTGILAAPFIAVTLISNLPIPSFEESAAATIRRKVRSTELTSLARSTIDHPPAWLKEGSNWEFSPAKEQWISNTPPLDRLPLSDAKIQVVKDTFQFHWGSPIAQRWGIAISSIPGVKPELPQGLLGSAAAYPEVWIFTLYD